MPKLPSTTTWPINPGTPPPKKANAGLTIGFCATEGATILITATPMVARPIPAATFLTVGLLTKGILEVMLFLPCS